MNAKTLLAFAGLVAAILLRSGAAVAAAPAFEKVNLFEEKTNGFVSYRIPCIVVTARGTVLAYCAARKYSGADWGEIEIHMRRSTDGGRTFGPPSQVAHLGPRLPRNPVNADLGPGRTVGAPGQQTVDNTVAIADRDGTVHFLYCVEYMRCFYLRSTDDGRTWSKPKDITGTFDAFRPEWRWRVIATGPGHGIQLRNDRLVVPVWLATSEGNPHGGSVAATIFSDDRGVTWHRGEIAMPNTLDTPQPSESTAVELGDGRVMLIARTHSPSNRKFITVSRDGATAWSSPRPADALLEPICMSSALRYCSAAGAAHPFLLYSGLDSLERSDGKVAPGIRRDRKNLTVKLSQDDGQHWSVSRVIEPGPSAYSDLAALPDGTILCLYESGRGLSWQGVKPWPYAYITLARFNLDWLQGGPSSAAATPPR